MMRTIAHLSDLHFGAADPRLVDALIDCVRLLEPDVVAVSGDLTQRARRAQFRRARAFLEALPLPQIVVPGNHDVPLYNVFARLSGPLRGFRRYISADPYPFFSDSEVAVVGVDTTRSLTIQDGGLRPHDVRRVSEMLAAVPGSAVRVVVCHHPFDPLVGRRARWTFPPPAPAAVNALVAEGADVFLTGHLHFSYVGHTATRYQVQGRSAIVVEAGTATSVRVRGEVNSFNVLRLDADSIAIERVEWHPEAAVFRAAGGERFVRNGAGWAPCT